MADWISAYLKAGGYPDTAKNRAFLSTWQRFEGGATNNNAAFNYLNTIWNAPGAKSINSVGVKAYGSLGQGAAAWAATLKANRNYAGLDAGLRAGNPYTKASVPGLSTWLSGSPNSSSGLSYATRVLGTKLAPAPQSAPTQPSALMGSAAGPSALDALRTMTSSALLAQSAATAAGQMPDMTGLLALATARRAILSQPSPGNPGVAPSGTPGSASAPAYSGAGVSLKIEGQYGNENPHFLSALTAAAKARCAVAIQVTSGERSAQHNAAVGGASNSNHLPDAQGFGHALDGYAILPNGSKVPLGQFLLPVAAKYGLRSGATFQWGGKPDVVHVDDAYNQR